MRIPLVLNCAIWIRFIIIIIKKYWTNRYSHHSLHQFLLQSHGSTPNKSHDSWRCVHICDWCMCTDMARNTEPVYTAVILSISSHCLVGLENKASASGVENLEFDLRLRRGDFSGLSHSSDLKMGTPVATLACTWCYMVSAGTGWPGVSIQWPGEVESLICKFYHSVAAGTTVWADPFLRYTSMLLGR